MHPLGSGAELASHAVHELLARSVVDGLSAQVAVVDGLGAIVFVNEAWRAFARANGGDPEEVSEGANYLRVCDSAEGRDAGWATEFAVGLGEVLGGRRRIFELTYPCHAPDETRWFVGRATRLPVTGPPRAVVAHEDVTARVLHQEERERARIHEAGARIRAYEQRRIGRELHDRVAHLMGVAHQGLELHRALKGSDPGKAEEKLGLAGRAIKEAMAATRDLSQALREDAAGEGLEAALSSLLSDALPPGMAHELSVAGDEGAVPAEVREQLFLVLREAVRNAVRHSGASKVAVSVGVEAARAVGTVEDDGRGFERKAAEGKGDGLAHMSERALLLGGACSVDSAPGEGTRVVVSFPVGPGR